LRENHGVFLEAAARQAETLHTVAHRPWPLRDTSWSQAQTRLDVLFAHWRVPLDVVARLVPPGLAVDTHDGDAWLGLVPLRLAHVRLRGLPPLPGVTFAQLDVRTYVTLDGRPGVWLCSVDLSNPLLLEAAKRAHRLPAYRARISADGGRYSVSRDGLDFCVGYRAVGEARPAEPGSLEHFLTERYCIYTADGGRLYRAELHHAPWQLRPAEASIESATISPVALEGDPHVLHAATQDVLVWPLEEL
jgi:uncharacterized protein YqjF (DUF2071 family)